MDLSSKLSVVKNAVTSKAARQVLLAQKHSPVILFAAGTAGVVTSTVLACKATLKLEEVTAEHNENLEKAKLVREEHAEQYSEHDYRKDVTVLHVRRASAIFKLYGPALSVGALSVCALGGSHLILTKRNAGLMAAYAALDKGFKEYRDRVLEEVGPETEKRFRVASEDREIVDNEGREVSTITTVDTKNADKSQYARIFEQGNQNWSPQPEYNIMFLRAKQNWLNDKLHARGHVFLNEVYDELGMERTKAGAVVGWVKGNGDNYIDFGVFDGDNPNFVDFATGREGSLWLDFNVDGVVWDLI